MPSVRPIVAALGALGLLGLTACAEPAEGPVEQVMIPRGAPFSVVVDSLEAHGLVGNRILFTLVARVGRWDRSVKAGLYELRHGTPAIALLKALESGKHLLVRFTVPEGFTLIDIARAAEEQLGIPAESTLGLAHDRAWLERQGIEGPSAEGFLLPETYLLPTPTRATDLLEAMAAEFRQAWQPAWDSILAATGRTRRDVVILASIVEGEARTDEERPVIAGVYSNRLRIGMALQADPTVQYAIQLATGQRKPRLFERDYQFESPYNTYLRRGLPPGPIGAPSRKSIEAALQPAAVPYFFFVAGPEGRHTFTRTYREHLRAVAQSRRAQ